MSQIGPLIAQPVAWRGPASGRRGLVVPCLLAMSVALRPLLPSPTGLVRATFYLALLAVQDQ